MPRPKLARDAKYPPVKLTEIEETVKKFAKEEKKANTTKNPLAAKVKGDFEEFESEEGSTEAKEAGKEKEGSVIERPHTATAVDPGKESEVPDYCLVRFFDVLVRPGDIYEYQVQIRTANPNEKKEDLVAYPTLAKPSELVSPWSKSIIVPVPPETYVYAMEKGDVDRSALRPDRETAYVQIQRWTPAFKPDSSPQPLPVGEWSIADVGVHRGEYVGHLKAIDLPLWVPTKESYELAKVKDKRIPRGRPGAPIDFSTYAVLVDFEGGKGSAQQVRKTEGGTRNVTDPTADLEMLLYVPDANNYRLIVRSSQADVNDPQRKERHEQWTKWIEEVKQNKQKPSGTGQEDPFKTKPKGKP